MPKKKTNKKYAGFSLLEMIISLFIFSLIMTVVVFSFVATVKGQKKAREVQHNVENSKYAMELMAKTIRMGSRASLSADSRTLYFFDNSQGKCVSYKFDSADNQLQYSEMVPADEKDPVCGSGASYPTYTQAAAGTVSGKFILVPTDSAGKVSGRMKVIMTIGESGRENNLETSVSFRDYQDS